MSVSLHEKSASDGIAAGGDGAVTGGRIQRWRIQRKVERCDVAYVRLSGRKLED
ncbi:MAG: hypothetical protein SOH95_03415 [Bifidobacterium crudilactis]|jgi:hypothetical protein|nr:hypothetical protein [Bifidobacterium crudilactis]